MTWKNIGGFNTHPFINMISFSEEEITSIEQQSRIIPNKEIKNILNKAVEKMKSINRKHNENSENNLSFYMQTEGYAIRQSPQYKIDIKVLSTIKNVLENSKMLVAKYHNTTRLLKPLGIIYGEKIYLVAKEKAKGRLGKSKKKRKRFIFKA